MQLPLHRYQMLLLAALYLFHLIFYSELSVSAAIHTIPLKEVEHISIRWQYHRLQIYATVSILTFYPRQTFTLNSKKCEYFVLICNI